LKTSDLIHQVAAEIDGILSAHQMPIQTPDVVEQLRRVASRLTGLDSNASGNAFRVVSIANDYYSTKNHLKYQGGVEAMWRDMLMYLEKVRDAASIRESNGD